MDQPAAVGTEAAQKAATGFRRDVIRHAAGRALWRATANAEHFAGAARLLLGLARFQKSAQFGPENEERSLPFDHGEAFVYPSAYGVIVHFQKRGGF
jgi:hypothetical protein